MGSRPGQTCHASTGCRGNSGTDADLESCTGAPMEAAVLAFGKGLFRLRDWHLVIRTSANKARADIDTTMLVADQISVGLGYAHSALPWRHGCSCFGRAVKLMLTPCRNKRYDIGNMFVGN